MTSMTEITSRVRRLEDEAGCVEDAQVATQEIGWLPDRWHDRWQDDNLPRLDALELVRAEWEKHGTIGRDFISKLDDPEELFIAAMAWGFGDDARGPYRVSQMLCRKRPERPPLDVIADIVTASREQGAAAGFGALFDHGRTRVYGLGIAFGTKLIHFAGYGRGNSPEPLILDINVWKAAQELSREPPIPNPGRYTTSEDYEQYCNWAQTAVVGATPRMIEYTLFRGGQNKWPTDRATG